MGHSYSTFDYYGGVYGGTLAQRDYEIFARRAGDEIDYRCLGRAQNAPESMTERLARCECALAEVLHDYAQHPAGVTQVHNDGYEQHYGGAEEEKLVYRICRKYLTAPVNLMACGDRL